MAAGKLHFKSDAGGITSVSREAGATNGELVLPASGTVASVSGAVTDNAIARYDSTTGKLKNSTILIEDNGNLNITGTGKRITGDFSNPTFSSRVYLQASTLNSLTSVGIIPNGTSTDSKISILNSSDADNASMFQLGSNATTNYLFGNKTGTGAYLPMVFLTSGAERMKIDTTGNVGISDSNPQYKLSLGQTTTLPSTAGSKLTAFSKYTNVGSNASFLRFDTVRASTGNSHESSEERIGKTVDATEMGYVGFGDNDVNFGIAGRKLATLNLTGLTIDCASTTSQTFWSNSSKTAGTDWKHFYGTSNNNTITNIMIYGNGNIVNANNSYGALSDIKLKENIIDTSPKLDKLMQVRVVNYII